MPPKRDVLQNPILSEFVYDCLMKSTLEQKKRLNGKLLRATRTSRTAKSFATKSTMEEKAILLSKLGIPFAWTFNLTGHKIKELFEGRKGLNKNQLTDALLKERVLVITDKQIVEYLGLLASNCHSEIYLMNRDFLKAGYMAREFKKEYYSNTLSEIKSGSGAAKWVARMMVNAICTGKFSDSVLGVQDYSLSVLLLMYSMGKEYVTEHEMRLYFNGIYKGFKIGRAINELLKAQYVELSLLSENKEYRVTTLGVEATLRFEKRMFSMENL